MPVSLKFKKSNSYGQILYPHHPNEILSSGSAVPLYPGFLMAGYNPAVGPLIKSGASSSIAANFYIDKTGPGGALTTNLYETFQKEYSIYVDYDCGSPLREYTCYGVSVIQTQLGLFSGKTMQPSPSYALAGACSKGVFFGMLAADGSTLNTMFYPFSQLQLSFFPSNLFSKPLIIEATTSGIGANEYYICGSLFQSAGIYGRNIIYVLKVNSAGVPIWSSCYVAFDCTLKAIIESPYNSDLILVGDDSFSFNGFIMNFNSATGIMTSSSRVATGFHNTASLSSISVAASTNMGSNGFIIGGYLKDYDIQLQSYIEKPWFFKADPSYNVLWGTVISPSSDSYGDIVDVIERKNQANNYEYYGVTSSSVGIITLKLDDSGIPVSNGEFLYNTGVSGNPSKVNSISFSNANNDEGLHIFGTDQSSSSTGHYLIECYFTGHSGCNSPVTVSSYTQSLVVLNGTTFYPCDQTSYCDEFYLTATDITSYSAICGPVSSLPSPASNARSVAKDINDPQIKNNGFNVFPNPTQGNASITYVIDKKGPAKIELYNGMGQLVTALENSTREAGNYNVDIDFKSLGLVGGVYFINASLNGQSYRQKIVYSK